MTTNEQRFEAKTTTEPTLLSELSELRDEVRHLRRRTQQQDEWLGQLYRRVGLEFPGDLPTEVHW